MTSISIRIDADAFGLVRFRDYGGRSWLKPRTGDEGNLAIRLRAEDCQRESDRCPMFGARCAGVGGFSPNFGIIFQQKHQLPVSAEGCRLVGKIMKEAGSSTLIVAHQGY